MDVGGCPYRLLGYGVSWNGPADAPFCECAIALHVQTRGTARALSQRLLSSAIGSCDVGKLAWFVGVCANSLDPVQEMRSDEAGERRDLLGGRPFLLFAAKGRLNQLCEIGDHHSLQQSGYCSRGK